MKISELRQLIKETVEEAFFIGEDDIDNVECKKCGWKWKLSNGGENPYLCHKCDYDNSYAYNDSIDEYDVENADDIKEFVEFMREYQQQLNEADCDCLLEAEYQGRTVPLGKPILKNLKYTLKTLKLAKQLKLTSVLRE